MIKPKVIVISPSFELKGGVVEFNKMLLKYSTLCLLFFKLKSGLKISKMGKINWLFIDYLRFVLVLLTKPIDIVHINPSLGKNAIRRDGYFIRISKFFNKKVYVHWHGWNPDNEYLLYGVNRNFLKTTFFKSDHIKFLSKKFADKFIEIGYENLVTIGNTFIDDELLIQNKNQVRDTKNVKILFLSTVSKNKGIFLALEAFEIVKKEYDTVELIIAGIGPELSEARDFVLKEELDNVIFVGHVSGLQKAELFSESDIYLFPSYYEGMPTSVLEAMGFGLTLISSNAGAIPDFFVQEKMGKMINSYLAKDYSNAIIELIYDRTKRKTIESFNMNYAKRHFVASESIARIDQDYQNLIK